ncbi:MAG TPA: alpha-galactosidase [bacterium]|nr:alpha-galactosidase [bacterium]
MINDINRVPANTSYIALISFFALVFCLSVLVSEASASEFRVDKSDSGVTAVTDAFTAEIDLNSGLVNVWWPDGNPFIKNGYSTWFVKSSSGKNTVVSAGSKQRVSDVLNFIDNHGEGRKAEVSFADEQTGATYKITYKFYKEKPFMIISQSIENKSDENLRVLKTSPLQANSKRMGGFFPGPDPARVWCLENGHKVFYDFYVKIVRGDEALHSNWNAAYYDRETSRTSLIGFVTTDMGHVQIRSIADMKTGVEENGWHAFSTMKAEADYLRGFVVEPGTIRDAEQLLIGCSRESTPHSTLERFADAVADHYGIRAWEGAIPTGWNAWATKIHHALTEENMLENARIAAEKFLPYGMETFQIDDGWQIAIGDWEPNDRFPHGMKWIADEIKKLGFRPGLWIEPFCISVNSRFRKEHPDWISPKGQMAKTLSPKEWDLLDLTNPEAKKWLHDLFDKVANDWGYKFLKIDFIYYAMLNENAFNMDITEVEAYRDAFKVIRDVLPDDAFLIQVGVPTANSAGQAEALRLGLDIVPDWGDGEGPMTQGIKPMVRNLARRYYLNHRVWISHPDMFYLGSPEETERWDGMRVTLEEARTYATLSSLVGGIVKIGDSFTELNDKQTDLLRRLLPVYPDTARPVDLFECLYPEIWHMNIRKNGMDYDVVTFFNWGKNRRWGKLEEERDKMIEIDLEEIGLDSNAEYIATDFWGGGTPKVIKGKLETDMPARFVKVFSVRKSLGRPMFAGTNRHITQGATDIKSIVWDDSRLCLTGNQESVPGFNYELKFHVPDGFRFKYATVNNRPMETKTEENFVTSHYVNNVAEKAVWKLYFESEK